MPVGSIFRKLIFRRSLPVYQFDIPAVCFAPRIGMNISRPLVHRHRPKAIEVAPRPEHRPAILIDGKFNPAIRDVFLSLDHGFIDRVGRVQQTGKQTGCSATVVILRGNDDRLFQHLHRRPLCEVGGRCELRRIEFIVGQCQPVASLRRGPATEVHHRSGVQPHCPQLPGRCFRCNRQL